MAGNPGTLSWRIKERPSFTSVELSGELDENADFAELRRRLQGAVVFHLAGIGRINSCGVREWVRFVRDLPNVTDLVFTHCSPSIVSHLNMIYNFRGPATVRSFFAPYLCDSCGHEEEKLIDVKAQIERGDVLSPPAIACGACGEAMELDDLPERYLSFLADG
ncbi:MAG TPA: hypothetical protein VFG83_11720 [Kofleriaceae bacterium]|nr:hypothetical protein [Kofleriaceae bacterium]